MNKKTNSIFRGMGVMSALSMMRMFRTVKRDELAGVDIEAEMKLIDQKRSQLSVRLRNEVKARYKKN